MAPRLQCILLLYMLLGLLLLLAHVAITTTELTVRVVLVERGLLWLHVLLLLVAKLVESGGLRLLLLGLLLLLKATIATISVLEARLLGLHSSRLRVCVVEKASVLRLLLVLIYEVTEPVHLALLLVSLVVACGLVRGGLRWRVAKEEVGVGLLKLPPAQLLLLLAEFDCLCEIVVVARCGSGAFAALLLFLCLVLAGLQGQSELQILLFGPALSALITLWVAPIGALAVMGALVIPGVFLNACHAGLPRLPVGPFGTQSLLVDDERCELLGRHSHCAR
jgi:hypothetical protein